MRRSLRQKIRLMQKEICNTIGNINYGGCIYFAKLFSEELSKLNIQHRIVFSDRSESCLRRAIEEESSVNHVLIYIPRIGYIDGEEIFRIRKDIYDYKVRSIKPEQINLDNHIIQGYWNTAYNKSDNPRLKKIIQRHLNDY
jgi:hypothetical protein